MRDSMNHCLQKQPASPHLPLPDYVDSQAVLDEIRAGARLSAALAARRGTDGRRQGPRSWTPAGLAAAPRQPRDVALVQQERVKYEEERGARDCAPNATFGGLLSEGRPYLWVARGCRGIFRCEGSVLRCGLFVWAEFNRLVAARQNGRGRLTVCSCDRTESLAAARHWRDGRDHAANCAMQVTVPYRETNGSTRAALAGR